MICRQAGVWKCCFGEDIEKLLVKSTASGVSRAAIGFALIDPSEMLAFWI